MADNEFDTRGAATEQREFLARVQRMRDGINADVIDYYYNRAPRSEEESRANREGFRRYLRTARERIDDLLRQLD